MCRCLDAFRATRAYQELLDNDGRRAMLSCGGPDASASGGDAGGGDAGGGGVGGGGGSAISYALSSTASNRASGARAKSSRVIVRSWPLLGWLAVAPVIQQLDIIENSLVTVLLQGPRAERAVFCSQPSPCCPLSTTDGHDPDT